MSAILNKHGGGELYFGVHNPGTFPDGLTPEDFIEGSELSVKRNPLLAQLMYYVKDIESFGTGLKRITDVCEAAGVKVEFKLLKLGFSVIFYRPDISSQEQDTPTVGENQIDRILSYCSEPRSRSDIQLFIGLKDKMHFIEKYLKPLLETGQLQMTIPDKPNSKNQKYVRGQKNG